MRPPRCSTGGRRANRSGLARALVAGAMTALTLVRGAQAQDGAAQEALLFLLLPVGARTVGIGQAVVADRPGSEAVWWNPAALAWLEKREVALHHGERFAGKGDALTLAVPSSLLGTLAVSFYLFDYGAIPAQEAPAGETGKILPRDLALAASYATAIGARFSAGVNYKFIQTRYDCTGVCGLLTTAASTSALDFGVQYDLTGVVPVGVGVALRNVGLRFQVNDRDQADPLPTRLQVGARYRLPAVEQVIEGAEMSVVGDVVDAMTFDRPEARLGTELALRRRVMIRAGYAYVPAGGSSPSIGIGFRSGSVAVDFARVLGGPSADTGEPPTHLSLRYLF